MTHPSSDKKTVPRWTDRTDKTWPVEVVPAWAYDELKKDHDQYVAWASPQLERLGREMLEVQRLQKQIKAMQGGGDCK